MKIEDTAAPEVWQLDQYLKEMRAERRKEGVKDETLAVSLYVGEISFWLAMYPGDALGATSAIKGREILAFAEGTIDDAADTELLATHLLDQITEKLTP